MASLHKLALPIKIKMGDGATYLYSTTGWCEPLRDDIGFP
jgi:hypothetical protein